MFSSLVMATWKVCQRCSSVSLNVKLLFTMAEALDEVESWQEVVLGLAYERDTTLVVEVAP